MIPKVILVWSDGQAPTTTDISEGQGRELQVDQISSRKLGIYEIRFSRFQYSTHLMWIYRAGAESYWKEGFSSNHSSGHSFVGIQERWVYGLLRSVVS